VLDLALTLWIARAATFLVLLGFLILGAAPQAQDLLVPMANYLVPEDEYNLSRVLLFLVVIFVLWAMPTHYSARLALEDDERLDALVRERQSAFLNGAIRWVPRLLGASTFLALAMGANRAWINLPVLSYEEGATDALRPALNWLMVWCLVAAAAFIAYTMVRRSIARLRFIAWAEALADRLAWLPGGRRRNDKGELGTSNLGRLLLLAYFLIFVGVLWASPFTIADLLPRAWTLGLVLGGWLPVLTFLSIMGRRWRAPLIILIFAGVGVLIVLLKLKYEVRVLPAQTADVEAGTRIPLDRAVSIWMKANNCSGEDCPRPIIIMAAGGASRAGFFTVSVIGELLDRGSENGLSAAKVRNRIFAISGISGGAVGAVTAVTAMANGKGEQREQHPCKPQPVELWYGRRVENWRGCLEALNTGDSLTPTFIGLTFHDLAAFGPKSDARSNRATLLEQSWERRMREALGDSDRPAPCPRYLECPFLLLRPSEELWLPLLILNGTSVNTGQRIVTTLLEPTYAPRELCPLPSRDGECRVFAETFHFHDMIGHGRPAGAPLPDIALSTAALNSARFPLISPPGEILDVNKSSIDRIVDGGYLENYGALSAIELVTALRAVAPQLKPFVLALSNDPSMPLNHLAYPEDISATDFVTDATSVLEALMTTRDARGSIAVTHLQTLLNRDAGECTSSFAHVRVWPITPVNGSCARESNVKAPAISMSWWLSTPVQLRLVAELDRRSCNAPALMDVWEAMKSKAACRESRQAP
jgi:hypothetical protein